MNVAIPPIDGPGTFMEQRLVYLENAVCPEIATITGADYARAAQYTTTFHNTSMNLGEVTVGR